MGPTGDSPRHAMRGETFFSGRLWHDKKVSKGRGPCCGDNLELLCGDCDEVCGKIWLKVTAGGIIVALVDNNAGSASGAPVYNLGMDCTLGAGVWSCDRYRDCRRCKLPQVRGQGQVQRRRATHLRRSPRHLRPLLRHRPRRQDHRQLQTIPRRLPPPLLATLWHPAPGQRRHASPSIHGYFWSFRE